MHGAHMAPGDWILTDVRSVNAENVEVFTYQLNIRTYRTHIVSMAYACLLAKSKLAKHGR